MLIGTQLGHRYVTGLAATMAFDEDANDDEKEGQGASNGEADEYDEAEGKVVCCLSQYKIVEERRDENLQFEFRKLPGFWTNMPLSVP